MIMIEVMKILFSPPICWVRKFAVSQLLHLRLDLLGYISTVETPPQSVLSPVIICRERYHSVRSTVILDKLV
ncbi:hypothetical protein HanIR_Chr06g0281631 [Helianthus annuus]|nr:hypothetical protein HanIR_Chr06g0281631 [Helianthus annuus]